MNAIAHAPLGRDQLAVTEARVIRSEALKFRTVRSNLVAMAAAVAVAVALGAVFTSAGEGGGPRRLVGQVALSLAGFRPAQLIIGVVGVLFASAEYSTGTIRTTFAAVRSRLAVLRAKVVVYGTVVGVLSTVTALVAFFVGRSVYTGATVSLGDPGVLRVVLATAAYTVAVGLLGLALGFLLRSTAGAVGVLLGSLLLLPALMGLLPWSWAETATKLLPSNAGDAITSLRTSSDLLSTGQGAVTIAVWVAGMLALAGVALVRRDA